MRKCYTKNLEGLAQYISDLSFEARFTLYFENNKMKRTSKTRAGKTDTYNQRILEANFDIRPEFTTFYDSNECLIKLFLRKSFIGVTSQYLDSSTTNYFQVGLDEFFTSFTVSETDVESYSLDFREVHELIHNELEICFHQAFKKMCYGLWDKKQEWFITCDYDTCEMEIHYS